MSQINTYSPGTILSVGFGPTLEQVIVLSGDKVATKTFGGKPVERRDILSISDWQIVIGDQVIQTDYIPMPPNPLLPRNLARPANTYAAPESGNGYLVDLNYSAQNGSSSAILELNALLARYGVISLEEALAMTTVPERVYGPLPEPLVQPVAQPLPETYPVGTKLTWALPNSDGRPNDRWSQNRCVAIILKNGVIQVKEVKDGMVVMTERPRDHYRRCAQKFFSSLADWKQQLPAGGSITVTEVTEDFSIPSIQRKAKAPVKATDDMGYMKELQHRFSVHARLDEGKTPRARLVGYVSNMREDMTLFNNLTSPLALATTRAPREIAEALNKAEIIARRIRRSSIWAASIQKDICADPCNALTVPVWFINKYRQALVAFINGKEIQICSNPKDGLIALKGDPALGTPYGHFYGTPKTGKTFAELGIDLKADGKPRLKAYYRCESIEI